MLSFQKLSASPGTHIRINNGNELSDSGIRPQHRQETLSDLYGTDQELNKT